MLSRFFSKFGMNILITCLSLDMDHPYSLRSDVVQRTTSGTWFTFDDDLLSEEELDNLPDEYNKGPDYLYKRYRYACTVVENIYLSEDIRAFVTCFNIETLFNAMIGEKEEKIMREVKEIEEDTCIIYNIKFGSETHTILLYRIGNQVQLINTYGGIGKIYTKLYDYEEILDIFRLLDEYSNRKDKEKCKSLCENLLGFKLYFSNYIVENIIVIDYGVDDYQAITHIRENMKTHVLPEFRGRKDYDCLKTLLKNIDNSVV